MNSGVLIIHAGGEAPINASNWASGKGSAAEAPNAIVFAKKPDGSVHNALATLRGLIAQAQVFPAPTKGLDFDGSYGLAAFSPTLAQVSFIGDGRSGVLGREKLAWRAGPVWSSFLRTVRGRDPGLQALPPEDESARVIPNSRWAKTIDNAKS
jgi:hypothetical protein